MGKPQKGGDQILKFHWGKQEWGGGGNFCLKFSGAKNHGGNCTDSLHDFSVTIRRCYKDVYINSFFPRRVKLWNSLPMECFPLTNDLSGFKSRINRHLLTEVSF